MPQDIGKVVFSCIRSGVFPFPSTDILREAEVLDPSSAIALSSSQEPIVKVVRVGRRTVLWLLALQIAKALSGSLMRALEVDVAEESETVDEGLEGLPDEVHSVSVAMVLELRGGMTCLASSTDSSR